MEIITKKFKELGEHRLIVLLLGKKALKLAENTVKELNLKENYCISNKLKSKIFKTIPLKSSRKLLGRTVDSIFFDLTDDLPPREFGIVTETIKGPGILFLWIEDFNWINKKLIFHEEILTPPYELNDCRNIFQKRFLKILNENEGVLIIDSDTGEVLKENPLPEKIPRKKVIYKTPKNLSKEILKIAKTEDQVNIYLDFDKINEKKFAYVILANRGRGKSALLGLLISALILKGEKITLTAPSYDSVLEVFKFTKLGLEKVGAKYKETHKRIISYGELVFREPLECLNHTGNYLFIDEAAGIHVPILKKMCQKYNKIVISTTVHGYEGTGRLFQYRFLPYLKEKFKVYERKMYEPIRYGLNDPLEKFLYRVFCLDAEPPELENINVNELKFEKLDLEKLFLQDEEKLREFVGIYIFAHYRNNPKDVMLLADAPNHRAFCATYKGKVVGCLQVAEEGGLREQDIKSIKKGESPHGNITPDIMFKYFGEEFMLKNKGARIVRIAVHPKFQRCGIGSFLLENLEKEGYNWYSASFGGSKNLIRFWNSNNYKIVHLSPKMNIASGEYPVLVVKCDKIPIEKYAKAVKLRLLFELNNFYQKMEPEVVLEILKDLPMVELNLPITEVDLFKLKRYVKKYLLFDPLSDVFYRIVLNMYAKNDFKDLNDVEHYILIERLLKKLPWNRIEETLEMKRKELVKIFGNTLRKIAKDFIQFRN